MLFLKSHLLLSLPPEKSLIIEKLTKLTVVDTSSQNLTNSSLREPPYLVIQPFVYLPLQNVKKTYTQGLRFTEINYFYCFLTEILK